MSKELNNIDNFFRIPIEAENEMPSAAVWDSIQNNFDNNVNTKLKKKYKNLKRIAAVLLLLLMSSLFFIGIKNKKTVIVTQSDKNSMKKNINTAKIDSTKDLITKEKLELQEQNTNAEPKNNTDFYNIDNNKITGETKYTKQYNNTITTSKTFIYSNTKQDDEIENIYNRKKKNKSYSSKLNINIQNAYPSEDEIAIDLAKQNTAQKLSVTNNNIIDSIENKIALNVKNNGSSKKINSINKNKFSFGFYASPEVTFNRLEDDKPHQERTATQQPNNGRPREDRDHIRREQHKTSSFSTGIIFEYAINKKISLQSGIGFSKISTEINPKKVYAEKYVNGTIKYKNNSSLGTTYINPKLGTVTNVGDSTELGYSKNTVQYISLPINIMYHYSIGKLTLSPSLGFAANILVKQKATSIVEGGAKQNINTIEGVNNAYFNTNMALEVKYKLHKKIAIMCMPKINIALNSLNKNSNVKFYSNTAGLAMGLKYTL